LKVYQAEYGKNRHIIQATNNILKTFMNLLYDINYHDTDRLEPYAEKGFILLPKHQHLFDIPLEDRLLMDYFGRQGNFIMKSSLPKFLERYYGGIRITRMAEFRAMRRKKELDEIEAAKEQNKAADQHVMDLVASDEIVICHVEGTRSYRQPSRISDATLLYLLSLQKRLERQLTFIPLDIEYGKDLWKGFVRAGTSIDISVGLPIQVPDGGKDLLSEHLRNEIGLLE